MATTHGAGSESATGALGADLPDGVRNVVLVGHSGAGKTTLAETLLAVTKTVPRAGRVDDGTTVSDFDEAEIRQHRSIGLALAPLLHEGVKVNLLDTPGYADFVGDLRAGLRAADCGLFVVSAVDGVDGSTRMLWDECAAVNMPRAVVVTKVDHPRADVAAAVAACRDAFGDRVVPLHMPVSGPGGEPAGLLALMSGQLSDYRSGAAVERAPEPGEVDDDRVQEARSSLIEAIIEESEDETLMDRYLAGEEIPLDVLVDDLEKAVARGHFHPLLFTAAPNPLGTSELLEIVTSAFPSPYEHVVPEVFALDGTPQAGLRCDPTGPLLAEVVKTTSDPYVGRISLVRVFSGTLRPDSVVHVSGHFLSGRGHADHDEDEKIGALSSPLGRTQRTVAQCVAGDVCAVAKLSRAETGDTLSDKEHPLLMRPWDVPEGLLPVAVTARSKADDDKLSQSLARLAAEDPTLRIEHNAETRQLVLWCLGEAHADVLLDRLTTRYGVEVDRVEVRIPLRETFAARAEGHGRHVKQSGGHGQYAVCEITVEPLPKGAGFEFVDAVVGGAVPRQFIPSVEKGIRAQMEKGVVAGYPVVDLRVTLVDGKAHSVDSSDMAFQTAGSLALRDAATRTTVDLLEPVDEVAVLVADDDVGAVMSDLSGRRGHVLGTEPVGPGRTLVRAELPQVELARYAVDLRSLSHGTGSFTRSFRRYDAMPAHLVAKMTTVPHEG